MHVLLIIAGALAWSTGLPRVCGRTVVSPHACRCAPPPRAGLFDRQPPAVEPPQDGEHGDATSLARQSNRFYEQIQNISAPALISGFAETAPPEVQQAVRSTVVSLLGNLPAKVYDTSVASTGKNIASLMYSMQMTGYMFRNAEYRRSLLDSLKGGGSTVLPAVDEVGVSIPEVSGRIKVKLSANTDTEVEASAYMSELRNEVEQLRSELLQTRESTLEARGGGLLAYIQSLGRDNVASLTASVSQDVLDGMRLLIETVLHDAEVGGDTFMETSGNKLRELLVWQLVTGYKLRELEAREELNKLL
mmetsp:Transcript_33105/g.107064  ORF Transcript_33105/g.107064 Transcript_33105/m.107064 type:complete len:305 (-) Transcript_33105:505-1419(-)|eukprot:scaffold6021_cov117-Isochrysis_galbana.AAC.10